MEQAPRSKRKHRNKKETYRFIQKQQASQLSVAKFCELHRLIPGTFYKWLRRYESDITKKKPSSEPTNRNRKNNTPNLGSAYNNEGFIPLILPAASEIIVPGEASLFAEVNGIKIYQRVEAAFLKSLIG